MEILKQYKWRVYHSEVTGQRQREASCDHTEANVWFFSQCSVLVYFPAVALQQATNIGTRTNMCPLDLWMVMLDIGHF